MSDREPWIVKVSIPKGVPAKHAEKAMSDIAKRCRKWREEGPDPLVIPSDWEVYNFADKWEHRVVEHHGDVIMVVEKYEKDGWQVAGVGDGIVIFKRPVPLEDLDEHPIPGTLADVFADGEA